MIREGEVLIKSKPFVYVLKSKLRTERCDFCLNSGKLLRCSGCQYVFYCNRDCQKAAWFDHKPECSNLRKIYPKIVPDSARLIGKIIFKLKRGGGQEREQYSKTGFRMFKDLMSHYSDIKKDEKRMDHFTSIYGVLSDLFGTDNIPNAAELMGIYGRVCVNCFNILDPEMMSIAAGIYLGASIIDHSCEPNAVAVFEGTTLYIRALKDFQEPVDWSKVWISYIELLNDPVDRQEELQSTYYFLCQCTRCIDENETYLMRSMMCPNLQCRSPIYIKDINMESEDIKKSVLCSNCKLYVKDECYREFKEVSEFTKMHLQSMKDVAYIDVCKMCLNKQEDLFHPLNLLHVKTLDLAFESSIELNQWENARKYGTLVIPGYKRYYGYHHPLHGILLLKLGKINLYLENIKEALEHLEDAEKIIKITHGREHSLYRSELLPLWHQAKSLVQN
ncbi:SET and MYND domain containing, class 3 isoform X1 [Lycorma delicatula]|uniref:SET and MYND domain containing, class 3 isoform X1 n=1 Tax=Lycorma delicatula TaxID=130591 RepID=UPI003F50FC15